jgi:carotenoid 1,2-hydratase
VFSPYYRAARKNGPVNPLNHCAINVALYGGKRRWAMTERGLAHVSQSADRFDLGPSSLRWERDELVIEIDECCAPWPHAIKGRVRFTPDHLYTDHMVLDAGAQHFWQAVAPKGRIVVEFEKPGLSWVGAAYHDMNWGAAPLEQSFKNWHWSRVLTPDGTEVFYDLERRDGSTFRFGQNFSRGCITARAVPPRHQLSPGFWGMSRVVNSEAKPQLLNRLEDTPFYTRNHVAITVDGVAREAYHESLSLDRFTHPLVQRMLPYKMPRVS